MLFLWQPMGQAKNCYYTVGFRMLSENNRHLVVICFNFLTLCRMRTRCFCYLNFAECRVQQSDSVLQTLLGEIFTLWWLFPCFSCQPVPLFLLTRLGTRAHILIRCYILFAISSAIMSRNLDGGEHSQAVEKCFINGAVYAMSTAFR